MILYHASDMEVFSPEIRRTRYTKDFGAGFYCTMDYAQAERWAKRDRNLVPVINHYEFEPRDGLAYKRFSAMTDEWLDFIAACRAGGNHEYDLVEGPIYVNDFIAGLISREAFWALAKFKHPTHQICFHTPASLRCIRFIKSEVLSRKKV